MSTETVHIVTCDKCGTRESLREPISETTDWQTFTVPGAVHHATTRPRTFDMCNHCVVALHGWLGLKLVPLGEPRTEVPDPYQRGM